MTEHPSSVVLKWVGSEAIELKCPYGDEDRMLCLSLINRDDRKEVAMESLVIK